MEKLVFENLKKIWHPATKSNDESNLITEPDFNTKLLDFFQVGDFFYLIHHIQTDTFEYVSPSLTAILGYDIESFDTEKILSWIHPDDLSIIFLHEKTATAFLTQLPPEKVQKYKIRYDFRIKKSDGTYLRFLKQSMAIQSGDDGVIIRVFIVYTDITHLKTCVKSSFCFIGMDGESSYLDVPILKSDFVKTKEILSGREKEIMHHIINGKTSQQIADYLFLSLHTVNTHRKNILFKTNCHTNSLLIATAIEMGWV